MRRTKHPVNGTISLCLSMTRDRTLVFVSRNDSAIKKNMPTNNAPSTGMMMLGSITDATFGNQLTK
jgi:hypothetical protein